MKTLFLAFLVAGMAAGFPSASDKVKELFVAIRKGDASAVRSLLVSDPEVVNARGSDGVPAVRLAVYYRQPAIAHLLVEHGAKLDLYDAAAVGDLAAVKAADPKLMNTHSSDGATALGLACFFGHLEVATYLLDHGAEINTVQTNPAFPFVALHSAMSGGQRPIFDLLLARGADVNVREGGGLTVLHEAAALGDPSYVEALLKKGANPSAQTDEGKLPEDVAKDPAIRARIAQGRR